MQVLTEGYYNTHFEKTETSPVGEYDYSLFITGSGLPGIALRNKTMGMFCGYVAIPENMSVFNKQYTDTALEYVHVHGGLTYSSGFASEVMCDYIGDMVFSFAGKMTLLTDCSVLGFDCGHAADKTRYSFGEFDDAEYRTMEYVKLECDSLARQLCQL